MYLMSGSVFGSEIEVCGSFSSDWFELVDFERWQKVDRPGIGTRQIDGGASEICQLNLKHAYDRLSLQSFDFRTH